MPEQLKTISHSVTSAFDALVNDFTSMKDIVVTNFNFTVSSQSKRTLFTAFIFYVDRDEYIEFKKREGLNNSTNKPIKPKPQKSKSTKPKPKPVPTT